MDDWAWRKGRTYGSLLVDLEAHRVVDLLPDRSAPTLTSWLRSHPGVEVVTTAPSTEYARATMPSCPPPCLGRTCSPLGPLVTTGSGEDLPLAGRCAARCVHLAPVSPGRRSLLARGG
ncbi:transposase [Melittangium boletus]|uniref:transposase n=1 Tax=Melittangium boletus TaxID=83453 RepID=UPI001FED0E54|nr:transposase [Melittangium boletus]